MGGPARAIPYHTQHGPSSILQYHTRTVCIRRAGVAPEEAHCWLDPYHSYSASKRSPRRKEGLGTRRAVPTGVRKQASKHALAFLLCKLCLSCCIDPVPRPYLHDRAVRTSRTALLLIVRCQQLNLLLQFCLDQKLAICKDASKGEADYDTATGDEGDVQTKCFQRDSSLSYSVVTIFIILTVGLLIGALMKDKLQAHMSTSPLLTRWTQIGKRGSFNRSYVGVGR